MYQLPYIISLEVGVISMDFFNKKMYFSFLNWSEVNLTVYQDVTCLMSLAGYRSILDRVFEFHSNLYRAKILVITGYDATLSFWLF
jgi:hypothetical protein